jgi:hypothetical protein
VGHVEYDVADPAAAELEQHVRGRDAFLRQVAEVYAAADPDDAPLSVTSRAGSDEVHVGPTRREREERAVEREQWLDEVRKAATVQRPTRRVGRPRD